MRTLRDRGACSDMRCNVTWKKHSMNTRDSPLSAFSGEWEASPSESPRFEFPEIRRPHKPPDPSLMCVDLALTSAPQL